jgi:hypothetical protein
MLYNIEYLMKEWDKDDYFKIAFLKSVYIYYKLNKLRKNNDY